MKRQSLVGKRQTFDQPRAITVLWNGGTAGIGPFEFLGVIAYTEEADGTLLIEKLDEHYAVVRPGYLYYEVGEANDG